MTPEELEVYIAIANGDRNKSVNENLLEALKVLPVRQYDRTWLVGKIPYIMNLENQYFLITSKNSQTIGGKAYRSGLLAELEWDKEEDSPKFGRMHYFVYREECAICVGSIHKDGIPTEDNCGVSTIPQPNNEIFAKQLGLSKEDLEAWETVNVRSTFDWDTGIMTFGEYRA
ncbi:hypothetical protein IK146_02155 [Candidatus Saccharibacteria bacterium]|nr:hypothetical protein [Candidatus Saccharibacteria bacterium]